MSIRTFSFSEIYIDLHIAYQQQKLNANTHQNCQTFYYTQKELVTSLIISWQLDCHYCICYHCSDAESSLLHYVVDIKQDRKIEGNTLPFPLVVNSDAAPWKCL